MKRLSKALGIALIALGIHLLCLFSGAIPFFDFRCFDLLTQGRSNLSERTPNATVVVEIDEAGLEQYGQWPWPRILLAKGLENILAQRPAAVGIDILFPEPDRTSPKQLRNFYRQRMGLNVQLEGLPQELLDHDQVLAHVLASGPTVLPLFGTSRDQAGETYSFKPGKFLPLPENLELPKVKKLLANTPTLQQAARGLGYINAKVDSDGIFRRQPLFMDFHQYAVPNLAVAMLLQVDPGLRINPPAGDWSTPTLSFVDRTIPFARGGMVLNPPYAPDNFTRVSMADVLAGRVPESLLSGKLVLIGATAAGLFDQFMTTEGDIVPGVYVHASLLENIMADQLIYQPDSSRKAALLLSLLFSIAVIWLVFERHYLSSWILYLATVSLAIGFAWYQLEQGRYISVGYFLTPFSILFFFISLFFAVLHYVERKRFLEDLGEAHSATIDSMTMVAESRDVETGSHIIRTKEYVRLLAEHLRHNSVHRKTLTPHVLDLLYRAAPLHDIGKVGIPDAILQKAERLNEQEWEIMHSHVEIGRTVIENAINSYNKTNEFLTIASNIAYSHHEKWDGSGYPLGLKGEDIPLEGRMMALADVYDALISRRYYKEALSFEEAEAIILADRGKHFDPAVVDAFAVLKDEFRAVAQRYNEEYQVNVLHIDPIREPAPLPD